MENYSDTKTQTIEVKKTKKKKSYLNSNAPAVTILIVGVLVVLIPCLVLAYILLQASLATDKPVVGERFDTDLTPMIEKANIEDIEKTIKSESEVEKVEVVLSNGQLRIYIDTNDSASKNSINSLGEKAYELVEKKLPIGTYFTDTTTKRMYDLSINVYNYINNDESWLYYSIIKNSASEEKKSQWLNEAQDPILVEELYSSGE